jgi:murein L,D-transpeptidase YcbB/YkuD
MRLSFTLILAGAALLLLAACGGNQPVPAESAAPPQRDERNAALRAVGVDVPVRGKFVVVNIPSFELVAFENGTPVLRSRVVVGRHATPTPELATAIVAVKFNPSWTPTPAMVRWEGARFMPPGPHNPLGRVLFELDNDQLIFMHDTNDRSYFEKTSRAFSHGCIRVEQARELAGWALDMTRQEIDSSIGAGATRRVPLAAEIPTRLVYRTRFPDAAGRLIDHPDVYGRGTLAQAAGDRQGSENCSGAL